MLFGAACTHVTDPIAKASKHWRITQVSDGWIFNKLLTIRYIRLMSRAVTLHIYSCSKVLIFVNVQLMFYTQ